MFGSSSRTSLRAIAHSGPLVAAALVPMIGANAHGPAQLLAASQNLDIGLHRVELSNAVIKDKGPASANHLSPSTGTGPNTGERWPGN